MPAREDRPAGTRSRAGNAMARTQAAVVAGVGACLAAHGVRRTTMIDIAAAAGIAKGTLYNHVRTKNEALALYADEQVGVLLDVLGGGPQPGTALAAAAEQLAVHPVLDRLRADEPQLLAGLLVGPAAAARRAPVLEALADLFGAEVAPVALRWLTSLLVDPGTAQERASGGWWLAERGTSAGVAQPG